MQFLQQSKFLLFLAVCFFSTKVLAADPRFWNFEFKNIRGCEALMAHFIETGDARKFRPYSLSAAFNDNLPFESVRKIAQGLFLEHIRTQKWNKVERPEREFFDLYEPGGLAFQRLENAFKLRSRDWTKLIGQADEDLVELFRVEISFNKPNLLELRLIYLEPGARFYQEGVDAIEIFLRKNNALNGQIDFMPIQQ